MMRLLRLLIFTLVIGCVALFSGAAAQVENASNVTADQTGEVNLTITSPEDGASLPAGNVMVSVNLTNFTLVEPTGQANAPGEGHLHYYLDAVVPTNASAPAIPETGGYVISTNTSHTWENVTPGEHNLSVQVTNNDHTPLIPLVSATVNVTVGDNATGNATPAAAANVTGGATVVNIVAQGYQFDTDNITVPAGADVVIQFSNEDQGAPHNVAVYTDSSATEAIFVGEIIVGPAETVYNFTAPSEPGTYYFQCDAHPFMNGDFIVE
jgi:plastocyanin